MAKLIKRKSTTGQFAAGLMWEEYKLEAYHGKMLPAPAHDHCAAAFFGGMQSVLRALASYPDELPAPLVKALIQLTNGVAYHGVKRSIEINAPANLDKN